MTDQDYFDALETRETAAREADLFSNLSSHLSHAKSRSDAYANILADVDPASVTDRVTLAQLPLTRKSELLGLQRENPPFGGFVVKGENQIDKIFSSPGPIYEPQTNRPNYWRMARALYAHGIRSGDLVHNTYSYHLTPAGSILESAAFSMGCTVIPAGVGQTELQVQTIADLKPNVYVGTPSFFKIIIEKADEMGVDTSCITKASVSGEALPEKLRAEFEQRGISVLQTFATADLGLIAYETSAKEGLVIDESIILEIVRPGSGEPVAEGEVGEIVVTTFNPDYPLIRFATGDLSAIMHGPSPCGRTNQRIKGWMGRADQTTKVRGMFVRPEQVNAVAAKFDTVKKFRLTVSNPDMQDALKFQCHVDSPDADLQEAIQKAFREVCKVRAEVSWTELSELPNDGKVIDDVRTYD